MSINCVCCNKSDLSHKIINCCVCNKPYKTDCVSVTSSEARKIHLKAGFTWTCKNCLGYGNDLNSLKSALASLHDEIKILKQSLLESVKPSLSPPLEMEQIIQEISDREKRKNNIIVFGVKEGACNTNNEQIGLDTQLVQDICSSLNVKTEGLSVSRLGKFDRSNTDRRRPIKVCFPSETECTNILRNISKLKTNPTFSRLSIFRDRTPLQLQIYKDARAELNERLSNGETNLKIKYSKGLPTIVSSLN